MVKFLVLNARQIMAFLYGKTGPEAGNVLFLKLGNGETNARDGVAC
jgi:hypothetical protein